MIFPGSPRVTSWTHHVGLWGGLLALLVAAILVPPFLLALALPLALEIVVRGLGPGWRSLPPGTRPGLAFAHAQRGPPRA